MLKRHVCTVILDLGKAYDKIDRKKIMKVLMARDTMGTQGFWDLLHDFYCQNYLRENVAKAQ